MTLMTLSLSLSLSLHATVRPLTRYTMAWNLLPTYEVELPIGMSIIMNDHYPKNFRNNLTIFHGYYKTMLYF
jgi:uncharacterized protein (DUF2249 family)